MNKNIVKYVIFLSLFCSLSLSFIEGDTKHTVYNKEQEATFFKEFDQAQSKTNTIVSQFIEKKELTLLDSPVVSRGVFYYRKPNQILWEYHEPDVKKFLLTGKILLSYYPKEKKAEQINIKRFSGHVFKFICIGQLSKDLKNYYKMEISNSRDSKEVLMTLIPKKRKVKKRIDHLKLWIDRKTFQLSQLQYVEVDGDRTTITFEKVQVNAEVPASTFEIDLPSDVEISEKFTEFLNDKN